MNLAEVKQVKQLSSYALAKKAGLALQVVRRIELGTSVPIPMTAHKIADALEMKVEDIEELEAGIRKHTGVPESQIRFGQGTGKSQQEAHCSKCWQLRAVLKAALVKKRITYAEACRRAGLSRLSFPVLAGHNSKRGHYPLGKVLEQLAKVLQAPELLTAIPLRVTRTVMTCTNTNCGETKEYVPSRLRAIIKQGSHPQAIVDEDFGTGTYLCATCILRSPDHPFQAYQNNLTDQEKSDRGVEVGNSRTQDQIDHAVARANEARITKLTSEGMSEEWEMRKILSGMHPRPGGAFGTCRREFCKKSVHRDTPGRAFVHRICLAKWRSDNPKSGWNAFPPALKGRRLLDQGLALSHELTVRYYQGETRPSLAAEFDMDEGTVEKRIDAYIESLPPEGTGDERLNQWSKALRWAWEKGGPERLRSRVSRQRNERRRQRRPIPLLREQLQHHLSSGSKHLSELAALLGKPKATLTKVLNRHRGVLFVNLTPGQPDPLWALAY